jgi:hypothetical protein
MAWCKGDGCLVRFCYQGDFKPYMDAFSDMKLANFNKNFLRQLEERKNGTGHWFFKFST